jgi:hypothetical protein
MLVLLQQAAGIGALDVVHRYPQPAFRLAAVVNGDDVRMPQRGGILGFAVEPLAIFGVCRHLRRHHLQRVLAWQPRVLNQIDLSHRA